MLNFGEKIKEAVETADVTIESLSKQTGIPEKSIYNWRENRSQPYLDNVIKLADFFRCSIDYLIGDEETKYEGIVFKQVPPFSQMLRKIIDEKNIVIKKFSKDIDIHESQIFKWLRGDTQPQLNSLIKISYYFGITIDCLIGRQ